MQPGRGGQMGRSAGVGIQLMAKEGDYATLRLPSGEMRHGPRGVPRDRRRDRQRRPPERHDRQGRPQAPHGRAPADARHGHEPGRSPARRRRGRHAAGQPPADAVGRADDRLPHPQEAQGSPTVTSSEAAAAARRVDADDPLVQEGPVRRGAPDAAHRGHEPGEHQDDDPHLVARRRRSSPRWSVTPSPSTTGASTCPCSCRSRWSATSSASSRRRALYRGHAGSGKVR